MPLYYAGSDIGSTGSNLYSQQYGAWSQWNQYFTGNSITACSTDAWQTWTSSSTTAITNCTIVYQQSDYVYREPTPEEQAKQDREYAEVLMREREQRRLAAERERESHVVAEALLESMLTDLQREQVKAFRYFTVEGSKTKRRYRVRTDHTRHGNIIELDEKGEPIRSYCVAPSGGIPLADALLGQKLCIEYNEDHFLEKANMTPIRPRVAASA